MILKNMTSKARIFILVAFVGILGVIGGIYTYRYLSTDKISQSDGSNKTIAQELQDCLPKSDIASKEKCDSLIATIQNFEQCTVAGFPIIREYPQQCQAPDGRIFLNDKAPDQGILSKAEEAVRTFMGNPNLKLKYITSSKHPSNFAVGKRVLDSSDGNRAYYYDSLDEWDRPIYILQQKEYINNRCEVYEYEVSVKTYQVVQVGVRYPEEFQRAAPSERMEKCASYGSLEVPLKTKSEIEKAAFEYLERDPEHTKFLLRSDIQPQYIPSKKGVTNPAANEWKWEDTSYKLPEGLVSDPFPYPTMRIIMTSGGKLIFYFNSTDLFDLNL